MRHKFVVHISCIVSIKLNSTSPGNLAASLDFSVLLHKECNVTN